MSNIIDKIKVSGVTYDIGGSGGGGNPTVELTQAEYDALVTAGTVSADTYYIITDAQAGDLTQYWTSAQTNSAINQAVSGKANSSDVYLKTETSGATQLTTAFENKQDTLVSGTNIKTINNESILGSGNIDIQGGGGGGKAISGGTNISITTGTTADTINCTLPISAGTNAIGVVANAIKMGESTTASSVCSIAIGTGTLSDGYRSFAGGVASRARGEGSFSFGSYTDSLHNYETAFGQYNVSNSNTIFSVGNGGYNARHNAFEIRQNGDIYITSGGTDIKLQDHLGGGGGGGSSYTAGDGIDITNDVISVTGKVDTSTYNTYTAATDTALASKQTTLTAGTGISIVDNVISATGGGGGGGMTEDDELLLSTALTDLNDRKIDASEAKSNYQKKGDYVTTNTLNTRLAEYETALDEQNVEEVTAYALNDLNNRFGGLVLVKITESEYAALTTKDENTLYIVVADPL